MALLVERVSLRWTLGLLIGVLALVALACGGGAPAAPTVAVPAPQQPAKPAPAAPAAEPRAPVAPAAPASKPAVSAAPAAPTTPQPKYGGSVSFFVRADPRGGFEPHIPGGRRETRATIGVALEFLAVWDTIDEQQPCSLALRPLLAESWRYPDPTTLEIKLRQGVKFHNLPPVNGRELVAQDVLFSYNRMFERGIQKSFKESIVSIEAIDKYTVRIKTKAPEPLIISEVLAFREAPILAKEAGGKDGKYDQRENIIGTGPFMLTEYTPGVGHVAKKHPDYWFKGRPYLDEVRMPIMRDQSTRTAALQVGKLDMMEEIETAEREQLVGRGANIRLESCEKGTTYAVFVHNRLPPFNDVRVRRALSMAMDREGLVKGVYRGFGHPVALFGLTVESALKPDDFPPQVRKYLQYNPAEAKKLLADAGYPRGLDVEVLGTLAHGTIWRNMLEALPAMAKPAGFNIKLNVVELARYQQATSRGEYGVAAMLKSGIRPPVEAEIASNHSEEIPSQNRSAVKDPELDKLIEKMRATVDDQARLELARQLQVRMVDQAYYVNYPAFFDFTGISRRVQGRLRLNEFIWGSTGYDRGLVLRDVWVTD